MHMRSLLLLGFTSFTLLLSGQKAVVYEPVEAPVYELLLELNGIGAIDFDPTILPFSRRQIATLLSEAKSSELAAYTQRQRDEIDFYRKDYGFEQTNADDVLTSYRNGKDSLFKFAISPYLQGVLTNNGEDNMLERGVGLSAFAYLGDRLGVYLRLNDRGATDELMAAQYLSDRRGGNLKPNQEFLGKESSDYSELNGGMTYAWDWGHVGLVKERMTWGPNQYGANILDGRNPSNVMIDLQMKPTDWFEFKYIHSWLVSEVLDSSRTYLIPGGQRQVFTNKNMAANMFGFRLLPGLRLDVGNSIIYSDNGIEPIYLIPLFFFKSADHNNSGAGSNQLGQNAQLFGGVNYSRLQGVWLYSTLFVDEVNLGEMFNSDAHTNLFSFKLGGRIGLNQFVDGLNLTLKGEYTRTNPWTYRHQIPSTTYATNNYNLGHYLGENAQEWALGLEYRPIRGLKVGLDHRQASKGEPHVYEIIRGNANVTGLDFLSPARWTRAQTSFTARYEVINNASAQFRFTHSTVTGQGGWVHPFEDGDKDLIELGFVVGF